MIPCTDGCIDPQTDSQNCGACGEGCLPGQVCSHGECATSCGPGSAQCADSCVDLSASAHHCGGCNRPCAQAQACIEGACVTWCPEPLASCGNSCIDVSANNLQCGSCGNRCGPGATCRDGVCIVPVTSVRLGNTHLTLNVGQQRPLVVTVEPLNATTRAISWRSSDADVATVSSSGQVTATGPGEAVITAAVQDSLHQASCLVQVTKPASGISLSPASLALNIGETAEVHAQLNPPHSSEVRLLWSSADRTVVSVYAQEEYPGTAGPTVAHLTAISPGETTISVTTPDGTISTSATVEVLRVPVTGVSISPSSITLELRTGRALTATAHPPNASDKRVAWYSSNPSVVSVNQSGELYANGGGEAHISAITVDGNHSDKILATVGIPVTYVTLNLSSLSMERGTQQPLVATILPPAATNRSTLWSTSDSAVATVSNNGAVTATGNGSASVTVTTSDGGYSATCDVQVWDIPIEELTISPGLLLLEPGSGAALTATVVPANATDRQLSWESSAPAVATVDQNGGVLGVSFGEATITAWDNIRNHYAQSTIHVRIAVTGVELNHSSLTLAPGAQATLAADVLPPEAHIRDIIWSSSNQSVADVTPVSPTHAQIEASVDSPGTTIITATTVDGQHSAQCTVTVGAIGEGTLSSPFQTSPPRSTCLHYLQDGVSRGDGVYLIDPRGDGTPSAFPAYCIMEADGGGWTLILKADGRNSTFAYDNAIWLNTTTHNSHQADLDRNEAKLPSFNLVSFTEVKVGMEYPINSNTWRWLRFPHTASSMHDLLRHNSYVPLQSNLGRDQWKGLIGPDASLQLNCNREGFNNYHDYARVRIGIISNQENDCGTPDSRIGIGGAGTACDQDGSITVGNTSSASRCLPDNGEKNLRAFGAIFIR